MLRLTLENDLLKYIDFRNGVYRFCIGNFMHVVHSTAGP